MLQEQLAAMTSGHGQFSIIGGEAGIGKTTLVRDLTAYARGRGAYAVVGHC